MIMVINHVSLRSRAMHASEKYERVDAREIPDVGMRRAENVARARESWKL